MFKQTQVCNTESQSESQGIYKKLRVGPSISVMDLQRVLLRQTDRSKDKGLFDCLKHPMNAPWSWKTAPCTAWLSKSADLLVDFLKIAPNGVLPSAKMRLALQRYDSD